MTVVKARWRASRITPSQGRRSSLISKFADADQAAAPIPLPTMVSIYQFQAGQVAVDKVDRLSPSARKACLAVRTALWVKQRCIVLAGPTKSILATVVEIALGGLDYHKICSTQAGLTEQILDRTVQQSVGDGADGASPYVILVVENVDTLPQALVKSLVELVDLPKYESLQVVLVGQSGAWDTIGREQHGALVGRRYSRVAVEAEAAERAVDIEGDLIRAWHSTAGANRIDLTANNKAVSPYPALAALLGQSLPANSAKHRKWLIGVTLIVFCGVVLVVPDLIPYLMRKFLRQ